MSKTVEQILEEVRKYVGVTSLSQTHKKIIDEYNKHKPLAMGYVVKYSDDWCDAFVSFIAIKTGIVGLIGTECGVERHIQIFKSKGIWFEDGKMTPKAGDIITYNWDKNSQPNDGWADHIGFVEKVNGNTITTIEGNYSRAVRRRIITVGSGNIRGYARPKYGSSNTVKFNLPSGVYRYRKNEGMRNGNDVLQIQLALSSIKYYPDKGSKNNGCDSWYGEKTANAVKRFQSMYGLKADGDYGNDTREKLNSLVNK